MAEEDNISIFSEERGGKKPTKEHKYLKPLLTIFVGIILVAGAAFGVWYWQQDEMKKQREGSDKQIQELQKQINELKKESTTTTESTKPKDQSDSTAESSALPTTVGACATTSITSIQNRIEGEPDMGKSVNYANGGYQVAGGTSGLDNVPNSIQSMQDWRVGDQVRMCLVSIPENCPAGDSRGKVYDTTNLRTNETWQAQDAWHSCGGA
ncbi:hypothetical protein C4544_06430 [candidate division WS5 bacterium]|uniref:Uncharacterized protein n=1 Tax=candidate division WS5 bacterium TaxID=2093353 RepID=A0A419DA58_9BACT|nr:MAG: hypothetical protein C4544_06430 [candidate division WS5 bacterium]